MCLGTEQGRLAVIFPPEPLSCPRSEYPLRWALGHHQGPAAVNLLDTRLERWTLDYRALASGSHGSWWMVSAEPQVNPSENVTASAVRIHRPYTVNTTCSNCWMITVLPVHGRFDAMVQIMWEGLRMGD